MAKKKELKEKKPLASVIDTLPTPSLVKDYGTSTFSKEALAAEVERLKLARARKAAFKAANAELYRQETEINEAEKTARRTVYAMLANAAEHLELAEFNAFQADLIEGLGYQPKYEVQGDEVAIRDWCVVHAPYLLEVNRRLLDEVVKAIDSAASYVTRPTAAPPVKVVECILPTITRDFDSLEAASEEGEDES